MKCSRGLLRAAHLRQEMVDERLRHRAYTRAVGDDMPDVRDWVWDGAAADGQPRGERA